MKARILQPEAIIFSKENQISGEVQIGRKQLTAL